MTELVKQVVISPNHIRYQVDDQCHQLDSVNEYEVYYVWFTPSGWHASNRNPYPNMDPKRPWYTCRAESPKDAEDKAIEYYKTFTPIDMQDYKHEEEPVTFYAWYTPSGWVATASQEPPPTEGPWSPYWTGKATTPEEACHKAEKHYDRVKPQWYRTVH